MGELGEDLGKVLRPFFLAIWKNLGERTQHWIEVIGLVLALAAFLIAIRKESQDVPSNTDVKALNPPREKFEPSETKHNPIKLDGVKKITGRLRTPSNPEFIPALALLFFAALGTWPYNFYILTRIIACLSLIWLALLIHPSRKLFWEIPAVIFALLFNPIAPFHFEKLTWTVFNLLGALVISPAIYIRLKIPMKAMPGQSELKQLGMASLPARTISQDKKYKYCESCSVRVGQSDLFCRRCGHPLNKNRA